MAFLSNIGYTSARTYYEPKEAYVESFPKIVVADFGSQYTQLIERSLRELGVRSMVLDPKRLKKLLKTKTDLRAIFLSGGGKSVTDKGAPKMPPGIFKLRTAQGKPVPKFGICYGMQLLTDHFGGRLGSVLDNREYGLAKVTVDTSSAIFRSTPKNQQVWASHGDSVQRAPRGFKVIARNQTGGIASVSAEAQNIYCTLFHPEVLHTPHGKSILANFAFDVAGCEKDWKPFSMIEEIGRKVLAVMGKRKNAVLGFSGGVDSTTLATILSRVMRKRLTCVVVDGGQFRENELAEIRKNAKLAGVKRLVIVDAKAEFLRALAGIIDSEKKRAAFKRLYRAILIREARKVGATVVIQGTLATDMIESGALGGELIKSHHNVGLKLPKGWLGLHPLGHLFKYEVRALAKKLGLPESVWDRQPFPGPGLFIRIVNMPVTQERLDLVRWADARTREVLLRRKAHKKASQLVVSYHGRLVGVKGDSRAYGAHIQVRGVKTIDFMTAQGVRYSTPVKQEIETTLAQHRAIVGVTWNEMNKPPCTTEPE